MFWGWKLFSTIQLYSNNLRPAFQKVFGMQDLSNPNHWTSSLMFLETNHTWGFSQNESLNYLRFDYYHFIEIPDLVALDKSTGLDYYGKIVIKNCLKFWRKLLLLIFQTIINKSTYPSFWKISQVSRVFQDGNKADVTCNRSICLLCSSSNLIEIIMSDRIYEQCHHPFFETQYGFRKPRSETLL